MAWTATETIGFPLGPALRLSIVTITADNSYSAGGETIDLSAIFPNVVYGGVPIEDAAQGGYKPVYDRAAAGAPATGKIVVYTGDYNPAADGPMTDEDGTPDLSAVCTGLWVFLGY